MGYKFFKSNFYFFFMLVSFVFTSFHASAFKIEDNNLIFAGKEIKTIGKRVSISSIVHLANISKKTISIQPTKIYLPAGKILLVTKECRNLSGFNWCFSITENGLPIFVRIRGSHYRKVNINLNADKLVISKQDGVIQLDNGKTFNYFTSRFYHGRLDSEGNIAIIVDTTDGQEGYDIGDVVNIESRRNDFSVVDIEHFQNLQEFPIIRPIEEGELIDTILDSFDDFRLNASERTKIKKLLIGNTLLTEKTCRSTIETNRSLEGEGGIDIDSIWSAVKFKLGVTAKYSITTNYNSGVEISAHRFIKETTTSGPRFYEAWVRKRREESDCDKEISSIEIIAVEDKDFGGQEGSITTASAKKLKLDVSETTKIPRYRCKQEYHKVINHLTQSDGQLSQETAEIVVAYLLRFTGGRNASQCAG